MSSNDSSHDEETRIRILGPDGTWVDLAPAEHESSGDPELDALGDMDVSDFELILEVDGHPLHGKAK